MREGEGGEEHAPEIEGVEAGKERQASAEARRPSWAHSVPAACVWRGGLVMRWARMDSDSRCVCGRGQRLGHTLAC